MGRSKYCDEEGLKKGPWTHEEDQKLLSFIDKHGCGSWRGLPAKAGNFNYYSFRLNLCKNCYIFI